MSTQAVILLVHGSRDPAWYEPFERLREAVAGSRGEVAVHLASLQFGAPDVASLAVSLAAEGVRSAVVIPLFMSSGGHVQRDIPEQLEAARSQAPGLTLTLTGAIGEMPDVRDAMVTAIRSRADTPPSA